MNKIFIYLALCICFLFAREQTYSPLPIPSQEVMDTSVQKCSKSCLNKLYESEQYFSFIANFKEVNDKKLRSKYNETIGILDAAMPMSTSVSTDRLKIALLIPQKNIGRYSVSSADTILAYLIARGGDFEFRVFDSQNEEINNLEAAYNNIEKQNYSYIIAILTPKGMSNLLQNVDIKIPTFIPTINQKQAQKFLPNNYVFFGGIDYDKQIDMMLKIADSKNASIIAYNDDGTVGKTLGETLKTKSDNIIVYETIDKQKSNNFVSFANKIKTRLKTSVIILNTSLIKSGLIIPQIGNTKSFPIAFLSSQLNYNPSLLTLVPKEDTARLFVVSAISPVNINLLAFSELLSSDLQYDWVNYATALSVDIFLSKTTRGRMRFFNEQLSGNQIIYNDRFHGVRDSHFVPVKLR